MVSKLTFKVKAEEYIFKNRGDNSSAGVTRHYACVTLLIDGKKLFDEYSVDMEELVKSLSTSGEYFIITCDCGIPECTGIHQGIVVTHNADQIEWQLTQPITANFTFSYQDYFKTIEELLVTLADNNLDSDLGCYAYNLDFHSKTLAKLRSYQNNI